MTFEGLGFAAIFFVVGTTIELAVALGLCGLVTLMAKAGVSK